MNTREGEPRETGSRVGGTRGGRGGSRESAQGGDPGVGVPWEGSRESVPRGDPGGTAPGGGVPTRGDREGMAREAGCQPGEAGKARPGRWDPNLSDLGMAFFETMTITLV
ncbi:hypothetical protein L6452_39573 [Arctium lappa]|uniref:Uncharacterized protein n=1 Tax=Arctium lappa TaxID=4217 RepID=A0ACB8XSW6_ARCLA|nr:hypothetical protein L6452_39573 [Arctium lappa]